MVSMLGSGVSSPPDDGQEAIVRQPGNVNQANLRQFMKARTAGMKLGLGTLALGVWVSALGQSPEISSFSQNGELVCSNLQPGSVATVQKCSRGSDAQGAELGGGVCRASVAAGPL